MVAIYGVRDQKVENVLKDFARLLKIPFITSGTTISNLSTLLVNDDWYTEVVEAESEEDGSSGNEYQIQMRPPFNRALVDLIAHLGWKKFAYMYDSYEGNADFRNSHAN